MVEIILHGQGVSLGANDEALVLPIDILIVTIS